MPSHQDSYLSGANIDFIEGLYARFLEDPSGVDASWQALFQSLQRDGKPITMNGGNGHVSPPLPAAAPRGSAPDEGAAIREMQLQSRVAQAVYAFRLRGHLAAQIDPLERPRPPLEHVADLS